VNNQDTNFTEILYHQPGHLRGVNVIREIDGYLLTGGQDGRICIWDLNLEKELGCIFAHKAAITDIQKLENMDLIISTAWELDLKAWSLINFSKIVRPKAHISSIIGAKPLKGFIITAGRDEQLRKWIIKDGKFKLLSKTKIVSMSQILSLDNRLLISCQEGDKFIFDVESFKEGKAFFIKGSKVVKAIRKASKYLKDFEKKDPYALLFKISRRNGFPAIVSTITVDSIILGHEFGFVSIWKRDNLRISKVFFVHGKHITGLEIINNILYTTSLDSTISMFNIETSKIIKSINLTSKPFSLLKTSNNDFVVGLETGELIIFDKQLEKKGHHKEISLITGTAITPDNLAFALNSGHIVLLNNEDLKITKKQRIHDKNVLGLFYYNNKLISIGEDKRVIILDGDLKIIKEINFKHKITNPRQIKHYISLTPNHVLDLRKDEIIKGEISQETDDEIERIHPIDFELVKGDIRIKIKNQILQKLNEKELDSLYKGKIVNSLRKLSKAKEKTFYKQQTKNIIISEKLKFSKDK